MIQRFLKIASISDPEQGKNGQYIVVKFHPNYMLANGTPVASALSEGTRVVFGASKLEDGTDIKEDGLFRDIVNGVIKVGTLVEGEICKVQTSPYKLPGSDRTVSSYTCIRFAHEDLTTYVNKQLKPVYACMLSEGFLTAPEQTNRPVNASTRHLEVV